jgi:3'-phosphoadenosine 5'-phosphosulfate (PAPS) 3'-phosphatase
MRIGGAGNKCLHLLDDKACYLIHTVKSMKYWDTCAVEALIRGRFGIATDKDRKPVIYEPSPTGDMTIPNGFIIARSQEVYDLCYDRVGALLKDMKIEKGRC